MSRYESLVTRHQSLTTASMTRWEQIEKICQSVLELEEGQREAFLEKACAGDEELRREVDSLLRFEGRRDRFIEQPALELAAKMIADEKPESLIGMQMGAYQILSLLGVGGMGVVYQARDLRLKRFVAIKMLPQDRVTDPERKRRFIQEAQAASTLNHPNIITIYELGSEGRLDFIVMEFVTGKTLDQRIPRNGMRLNTVLKLALQMADALAKAHSAGIIHRDLKPTNVMVTDDGQVKILDFGVAKLTEVQDDGETRRLEPQTEEGMIIGTVSYMSPEQAEGKRVDARSDIFSFGAVVYEMITGQNAFEGDSKMSTLAAIIKQEPKPISHLVPGIPPGLEKVIKRCLHKDPAHRWQTMADVGIVLQEVNESESGKLGKASKPRRRRLSLAWTTGLLLALLGTAMVVVWLHHSSSKALEGPLTAVPLTSYPGTENQPSFSPDGNQVAFSWDGERKDNFDIYIKVIGPGKPLRLTTHPASDYNPAWSPDGRSIAFLRELPSERAEVLLMTALGGSERKLGDIYDPRYFGLSELAWSFDNGWLVISDRSSTEEPSGLFFLSSESGEKRRLTSPPAKSVGDFSPAVSPDGRTLAFVRLVGYGASDLHLLTISNHKPIGEPKQITFNNWSVHNPVWTPDGREIIFPSSRGSVFSVWRIAAAKGGKPQPLTSVAEGAEELTISRQGRLVLVPEICTWSPPGSTNPVPCL